MIPLMPNVIANPIDTKASTEIVVTRSKPRLKSRSKAIGSACSVVIRVQNAAAGRRRGVLTPSCDCMSPAPLFGIRE